LGGYEKGGCNVKKEKQ